MHIEDHWLGEKTIDPLNRFPSLHRVLQFLHRSLQVKMGQGLKHMTSKWRPIGPGTKDNVSLFWACILSSLCFDHLPKGSRIPSQRVSGVRGLSQEVLAPGPPSAKVRI